MKSFLLIFLFVQAIQCQFDFGQLVDKTKALQDIERAGEKVVDKINNFFGNAASNVSDLLPNFNKSSSVDTQNSTKINEKFINETLAKMESGVCIKEVP